MLTDRYTEWVAMLARSDAVLVQLVGIAAAAVLAWEVLRRLPEPWRARLRLLYLVWALVTLLTMVGGWVDRLMLTLALGLALAALIGRSILVTRRRPAAGNVDAKGQGQ